jgi:hypothetical protein
MLRFIGWLLAWLVAIVTGALVVEMLWPDDQHHPLLVPIGSGARRRRSVSPSELDMSRKAWIDHMFFCAQCGEYGIGLSNKRCTDGEKLYRELQQIEYSRYYAGRGTRA